MNNHQEYGFVDLGLPSGSLWATCNVGAEKPEDCGNYYAWGETETKPIYDRDEYEFLDYFGGFLTKYNEKDGLLTLQSVNDAATVNWGEGWRMPTMADAEELINNCHHSWVKRNNVEGSLYTAPNNNSIFLPAGGYKFLGTFAKDKCFYWLKTIRPEDKTTAMILFNSEDGTKVSYSERKLGLLIRPVCSTK